jgi:hypothetical protein
MISNCSCSDSVTVKVKHIDSNLMVNISIPRVLAPALIAMPYCTTFTLEILVGSHYNIIRLRDTYIMVRVSLFGRMSL